VFKLDHILIWADKDAPEIGLFKEQGFTSIISGRHPQQGTSGKYLFFLNFYIELLYISDYREAIENVGKFGCNYPERANWKMNNTSSPFGLALKMDVFDQEKIPFEYSEYEAVWMRDKSLLMAENNKNLPAPLIFVLRPKMEFPSYKSIEEMLSDDKPEDFKNNHLHENGIQTLTSYSIYVNAGAGSSKMMDELRSNGINIQKADKNYLELVFDNEIRKKEIDFNPGLPLKIRY